MVATKKVQMLALLEPEQHKKLKKLSANTRVPMQAYMREAVDDLLKKQAKIMSSQRVTQLKGMLP